MMRETLINPAFAKPDLDRHRGTNCKTSPQSGALRALCMQWHFMEQVMPVINQGFLGRHAPLLFLPALVAAFPAAAREPSPALDPLPRPSATFAGRVFFTATERRALDAKARAADVPTPPPPAAPPDPRRFDGALWREGRIVALWFDGDAVKPAGEPTIRLAGDMPGMTGRGRPKTLLPGQTWLPQSGGTRP